MANLFCICAKKKIIEFLIPQSPFFVIHCFYKWLGCEIDKTFVCTL